MAYLWQNAGWPDFFWDNSKLLNPLLELHSNQGILEGQMRLMGFSVQSESAINRFTQEIKNSFEIEGVNLDELSLRSSVARTLGLENIILANGGQLDKNRPHINSIVEVITDAVHNCNAPLSQERLFSWHKKLFGNPSGNESFNGLCKIHVGEYRTDRDGPMRVISGFGRNEQVHFEAPPAGILQKEMSRFFDWFNFDSEEQNLSSVIKSAVAHLYFVELHPFEDGNGRIARLLVNYILTKHDYPMIVVRSRLKSDYLEALHAADQIVGPTPSKGAHASLTAIRPFLQYFKSLVAREVYTDVCFLTEHDKNLWWYDGERIEFRTENYANLLMLMMTEPVLTLEEIQRRTGINMSAVKKLVNQLVDKHYIERGSSNGSWRVFITPSI